MVARKRAAKSTQAAETRPTLVGGPIAIRYGPAAHLPAEFVGTTWATDLGPAVRAYEVRFYRAELPGNIDPANPPSSIDTTCVARLVLSDSTLEATLRMLAGFAVRLGLSIEKKEAAEGIEA